MDRRLYLERPLTESLRRVRLDGDEGRHAARVLRAQVGATIELFDGRGAAATASITSVGRDFVECEIHRRWEDGGPPSASLTIGVALPKGDRQKWLVEKATELGVSRLAPLLTERNVAEPGRAIERLRRTVIEACKQCRRNRLMEIAEPISFAEFVAADDAGGAVRWIAHPGGASLAGATPRAADPLRVAIGPEGGFSDAEITMAVSHGWQTISLGIQTLRVETAALAIATWHRLAVAP